MIKGYRMSDTGPSCPSSPHGHFSYIFYVSGKNVYLLIADHSILHKFILLNVSIVLFSSSPHLVCFFFFLSFDLSVAEIVVCIKSLTVVVNLTISPFHFIKISFQQNAFIFPGLDIPQVGRTS